MKIKKDFILREMDDMTIVVAVGESAKAFNGVINLNETATFIWKQLSAGCTLEELIAAVTAEYDIDEKRARADVEKIIETLKKENIIDD